MLFVELLMQLISLNLIVQLIQKICLTVLFDDLTCNDHLSVDMCQRDWLRD